MNRKAARTNLLHAVRVVTALFKAAHDYERGLEAVEAALKAHSRDEREPGRDEKEAAESRLARLLRRYWRRQAERIQERLAALAPDRKAVFDPRIDDFDDIFDVYRDEDADLLLALAELFADGARGGITLFAETSPVQIDWSLTNSRAAEWARGYAFDLVRGINDTTRQVLRDTISAFVDTPGMTLGQVVDSLPFDRDRAEMVATTEITRAYAEGNMQAGQAMREEFPDVRVVKIWYTSADAMVCPVCSPLNGVEVDLDKPFVGTIDKPPAHPRCRCWMDTRTKING